MKHFSVRRLVRSVDAVTLFAFCGTVASIFLMASDILEMWR